MSREEFFENLTFEEGVGAMIAAEQCIKLSCHDCAKGHDVLDMPKDNNLWHRNGNPCRAYRLRRFFNILGAINI